MLTDPCSSSMANSNNNKPVAIRHSWSIRQPQQHSMCQSSASKITNASIQQIRRRNQSPTLATLVQPCLRSQASTASELPLWQMERKMHPRHLPRPIANSCKISSIGTQPTNRQSVSTISCCNRLNLLNSQRNEWKQPTSINVASTVWFHQERSSNG